MDLGKFQGAAFIRAVLFFVPKFGENRIFMLGDVFFQSLFSDRNETFKQFLAH